MAEPVHPMVLDLSHWDPASSYAAVKSAGYVGVIFKATEGAAWTDASYVSQQKAAKAVGLKWGSYHFADGSSVNAQIENYLRFASPDPDELFCLDWEDNGGNRMSATGVQQWITAVEGRLGRNEQCVIYSGNTAKENLSGTAADFCGKRRLWLCQYTSVPTLPRAWSEYWLWQFTDGQYGPSPHSVPGVGHCDINSYKRGNSDLLRGEWATGTHDVPAPPVIEQDETVDVVVTSSPGVKVTVRQIIAPVTKGQALLLGMGERSEPEGKASRIREAGPVEQVHEA